MARAGLPHRFVESRDGYISEHALATFIHEAGSAAGQENIGLLWRRIYGIGLRRLGRLRFVGAEPGSGSGSNGKGDFLPLQLRLDRLPDAGRPRVVQLPLRAERAQCLRRHRLLGRRRLPERIPPVSRPGMGAEWLLDRHGKACRRQFGRRGLRMSGPMGSISPRYRLFERLVAKTAKVPNRRQRSRTCPRRASDPPNSLSKRSIHSSAATG